MENKVNKWKLNGIKVISENDLDDNTPQTKGMKRYSCSKKIILELRKYGLESRY